MNGMERYKMKRIFLLLCSILLVAIVAIGCSDNPAKPEGQGRLSLTAFDAPAPEGIEHLYIHIVEISAHHEDNGWMTLADIDTTIDFLELVNGITINLFDDSIPSGYYSQIRLLLNDSNTIVVDSVTYPLTIPSGTQTGIKLNLDEQVSPGEFVSLMVDFDLSKSVIVANNNYKLKPTYNMFKEDVSGMISGMVTDTLGAPVNNVMIDAVSSMYSTSTITDSSGNYLLILPVGVYSLSAQLDSTSIVDTTYTDINLMASDSLTGYNFIIQ